MLVMVAITSATARAQNGTCPGYTSPIGNASGTWPSTAVACRPVDPVENTTYALPTLGGYPCGQAYGVHTVYSILEITTGTDGGFFYITPPVWSTDYLRVRFYLTDRLDLLPGVIVNRDIGPATVTINSYTSTGSFVAAKSMYITNDSNVQQIEVPAQYQWSSYTLYLVDTTIAASAGGWLRVQLQTAEPAGVIDWALSSVQVGKLSDYDQFPAMCAIPGVGSPATPTPNWTPTPAGTPYATPTAGVGTPYPTAPAGTAYPTTTPAPVVFPTAQGEATPTPWQVYTMPSISFPSVNFPDIPPAQVIDMGIATQEAGGGPVPTLASSDPSDTVTRIYAIRDDWAAAVATSQAAASVDTDTGVGSPAALAGVVTENIGRPISYIKALGVYMPNAAPFVGALILMAAWVVFNVTAKPMIGVGKVVLELIRRLWEAIPLN